MGMVEARQHGRQLVLVEGALAQQVGERQGASQGTGHVDPVTGLGAAAHQGATCGTDPFTETVMERPAGHVSPTSATL